MNLVELEDVPVIELQFYRISSLARQNRAEFNELVDFNWKMRTYLVNLTSKS